METSATYDAHQHDFDASFLHLLCQELGSFTSHNTHQYLRNTHTNTAALTHMFTSHICDL